MPALPKISALLPLAMVAASCASAASTPVSDVGLRSVLRCQIEEDPQTLPAPDHLVDTEALSAELLDLLEPFDTAVVLDREITLTMAYQRDGLNMRREVVEHGTEPQLADSIQKLVFAHRLQLPETEDEWGVRLVIELGENVSYRVERREYCPPQPRNQEIESAMSSYLGSGIRYHRGELFRTVVVRVLVHPSGYVAGGKIVRGGVSGSTFEQGLIDYLRQFSFEPATIDGVPTYGYIDVPVQVRG